MNAKLRLWWHAAFLQGRSSVGLGFFRLFAAFTVGAHVIPTLLRLNDNYLSTAFKEKNPVFFPSWALALVDLSPDSLVYAMTLVFLVALAFFAAGLLTQTACVTLLLSCYYFYALNSLHIGTLSWDILLVTLFLLSVTPYPGDHFSLDALLRKRSGRPDPVRPFFLQRLLQLQIASVFFYTGLSKITAGGNWIDGNPVFYLLNSHPESVVKAFPLREFFAARSDVCHRIGITLIVSELILPFLLFMKPTRAVAIVWGFLFHLMLVITLHVPTIFLFLFPAQLLLFIEPESLSRFFESLHRKYMKR